MELSMACQFMYLAEFISSLVARCCKSLSVCAVTGRPVARKLEATRCTDEALTICRLGGPVRFQLRGAPELAWWEATYVDTQYTMINPTFMRGNTDNAIISGTKASQFRSFELNTCVEKHLNTKTSQFPH